MREIFKGLIPPLAFNAGKRLFRKRVWSGDFDSWELVLRECSGYSNDIILQKQIEATGAVLSGNAVFERDSCLFYEPALNFPVIASLMIASSEQEVSLVDFGGALGSSYHQNKRALESFSLKWGIVEQSHFVKIGRERFTTDVISFHEDLDSAVKALQPRILFSSSTLQYLEEPKWWIEKMISLQLPYILLDRISFNSSKRARLTKQTVPESIYQAEYPCWFLSEPEFRSWFQGQYDLMWEFENSDQADIDSYFKGFFFRRKDLR